MMLKKMIIVKMQKKNYNNINLDLKETCNHVVAETRHVVHSPTPNNVKRDLLSCQKRPATMLSQRPGM